MLGKYADTMDVDYFKFIYFSGLSVSFVHDIKTWDNGKYFTCLATNKAGSVTRVITLYVQCKCQLHVQV